MKKNYLLGLIILTSYAREQEKVEFISEGHLALPTSQETSPLFCFGQNIVDKGDIQAFAYINSLVSRSRQFTQITPNTLYGITDNVSLLTGFSVGSKATAPDSCTKASLESLFAQIEWAVFNDDHYTYSNQITLVGNFVAPLQGTQTRIASAIVTNAPSFFFGATASHMDVNWYYFGSTGFLIPVSFKSQKEPKEFLYQAGISRCLYYIPNKNIISLVFEFFGFYTFNKWCNQICNQKNNTFYMGPSLWISTKRFIFDLGFAFPVTKRSNGMINSTLFAVEIGWKFNS